MIAHTPLFAPIAVLAFLATAFLLCIAVLTLVLGLWRKSRAIQLSSVITAFLLLAGYAGILLAFSFFSGEVVLPAGGWKYFCEIDCHIAYSVETVVKAASVGGELQQVAGKGEFIIVGMKTWFDPETISPHRGNRPLAPNDRRIALVDKDGRLIVPAPQQEKVLEALRLHSTPLQTALRPGDSYTSYFVFELPSSAVKPKILLTTTDEESPVLWGHENSYFHKKIYFRMPHDTNVAALQ